MSLYKVMLKHSKNSYLLVTIFCQLYATSTIAQTITTDTTTTVIPTNNEVLTVQAGTTINVTGSSAIDHTGIISDLNNHGTIKSDTTVISSSGDITGNLNNYGSIINSTNGNNALYFNSIYLNTFTNHTNAIVHGTIHIRDSTLGTLANYGTVLQLDYEGISISPYSTVNKLINYSTGIISSTGYDAIWIQSASLDEISNIGVITALASSTSVGHGLYISQSHVNLINNTGTISASENGINIRSSNISAITNNGTILADQHGVYTEESMLPFTISNLNNGQIIAAQKGVYIDAYYNPTNLTGITNAGLIQSTSSNGGDAAIEIFEPYNHLLSPIGIINTGTIIGKTNAVIHYSNNSIDITLDNSGIIAGQIFIAPGLVTNTGLLALKQQVIKGNEYHTGTIGSSTITGSLTNSGTINLAIDSNTTKGITYSDLDITGDATFNTGSVIYADVKNSGNNITVGDVFTDVIKVTGTLVINDLSVQDNSALLGFTYSRDGTGIDLTAIQARTLNQSVASQSNKAVTNAASALNTITAQHAELGNLISNLESLSSDNSIASAISQTIPQLQLQLLGNESAFRSTLSLHIAPRYSLSKGGTWIQPLLVQNKSSAKENTPVYTNQSTGFITGADQIDINGTLWGWNLAYANQVSQAAGRQATGHNVGLGAYGSKKTADNRFLDWQVNIGHSNLETSRNISFATISTTAKGKYNTYSLSANLTNRQLLTHSEKGQVWLNTGLNMQQINLASNTETGAGALNLNMQRTSNKALALTNRLDYLQQTENGHWGIFVGIDYDLSRENSSLKANYQGDSSSLFTSARNTSPWQYDFGLIYNQTITPTSKLVSQLEYNNKYEFEGWSASLAWQGQF